MLRIGNALRHGLPWTLLAAILFAVGCTGAQHRTLPPIDDKLPRELNKFSLSDYVISPPDVLLIDAVRLVPHPPYKVAPLDVLIVRVSVIGVEGVKAKDLVPGQPIEGLYRVEPDGVISLGFDYGSVFVSGQTIPEAKDSINAYLKKRFEKVDFDLRVNLAESRALQQIRGEHLVRPDGQVTLGTYGSVFVAGKSLSEAKKAIQDFLSPKLLEPEISLDIAGFNSMVYYVIFDLDGAGQSIKRLPFTGSETVLDAIGQVGGLPPGSDRFRIWVARPSAPDQPCEQILPVDWQAITKKGLTATNYQLLPGDRLYVAVDPLVELDGFLAKVIAPIERVFGIILLGNSTIRNFSNNNNNGNGG